MKEIYLKFLVFIMMCGLSLTIFGQYQMENLDRGVLAIRTGSNNYISWRWLGTEDDGITFNLYRNGTKVNASPLTVCNYTDNGAAATASYTVKAVLNGIEQSASAAVTPWAQQYLKVPITAPTGGYVTKPDGTKDTINYVYNANDASVADLDGDGAWEIILKWDPSNSKDNSQSGFTGNTYIDAYKLNGTRLWRIDFGRNIRSGAHYLDFMVYDFDGDGKAEMMARTAEGTKDGTGVVIGSSTADYRNSGGYVLSGPEYVTVFNGLTGKAMATVNLYPPRGTVGDWGDTYGNRVDRFKACVAYLDGQRPSAVFTRGYYAKWGAEALDWRNGQLTQRWTYMCPNVKTDPCYEEGAHSVSVADVDGDGKHEIITGSLILDDNGTMYYNTTVGHGDALHVSDLDPDIAGLEVSHIQEPVGDAGLYMYSGKDKKMMWKIPSGSGVTEGPGRGVCADISAAYRGAESWVAGGGISGVYDCKGKLTTLGAPQSCNFLAWWDGDLLRELLNNTMIDKFGTGRLLTAYNIAPIASNNGSKSTPALSGDIFGDWREEVIWRASANDALYIFATTTPSTYKFRTFLHDPQYRVALAWQNTGYNQPPHVSYYLGDGMATPTKPNITIVGANTVPTVSITAPANNATYVAPASITINATAADANGSVAKVDFYNGTTLLGSDNTSAYSFTWTNVAAGTYTIMAVATDNLGATTTSTAITITVTAPACTATATASGNTTICQGGSLTLTASSGASYIWKNGTTQVGTAQTYSATASGSYTVEVTCANGGKATSTAIVVTVTTPSTWYADVDGDGVGDASNTKSSCSQPTGYVTVSGDQCPNDSNKTAPGDCGCGKSEGTCTDCAGVINGTATQDICGRCIGGNTGKTACKGVSEAEDDTCALVGIFEDKNEGFSGTGYVNADNTATSYVEFAVNSSVAGNGTISFRYANGTTADRPGQLVVNGTALANNISFPTTGSWIDWAVVEIQIPFMLGNNKVRLVSTTANGLPNIDQLGFVSSTLSRGTCSVVTLSADDLHLYGISLFPNPSSNHFDLGLASTSDVKVFSAMGTLVQTAQEVSHLRFGDHYQPGMYHVQISTHDNMYVVKVVKK